MAEGAREWTEHESLKTTQFGALVKDLAEIEDQLEDLEQRKDALRRLLSDSFSSTLSSTGSVLAAGRQVTWVGEGKPGEKLDKTKLILAGVTPDQIRAGTVAIKPRAAYLLVTKPKETSPS